MDKNWEQTEEVIKLFSREKWNNLIKLEKITTDISKLINEFVRKSFLH